MPAPPGYDGPQYDLMHRPWTSDELAEFLEEPSAAAERQEEWRKPRTPVIRFFEVADLGLNVLAREGSVGVAYVEDGTPLATAGLRVGDHVLAVNGIDVSDLQDLRRQLRRAFVLGGAELSVLRDGNPQCLAVSFAGWDLPAK